MKENEMGKDNALTLLASPESVVARLKTPEDVAEFLDKLKTCEQLLKAAKRFHDEACRYAMLEAATYARIIDLGFIDSVPPNYYQRQVVEWFGSLGASEREAVVAKCGDDGVTIKALWKKTVYEPMKKEEELEKMRSLGDYAVEEFVADGKVKLESYFKRIDHVTHKRIPSDVREGYKDEVRKRIRDLGGHSIGDGDGVYFSKDAAGDAFPKIVANKLRSIQRDVYSLQEFIDDYDDLVFDLEASHNLTDELSDESAVNAAALLVGLGKPHPRFRQPDRKARVYSKILVKLGITPFELFNLIIFGDERFGCAPMFYSSIDNLQAFGWTDEAADATMRMFVSEFGTERQKAGFLKEASA